MLKKFSIILFVILLISYISFRLYVNNDHEDKKTNVIQVSDVSEITNIETDDQNQNEQTNTIENNDIVDKENIIVEEQTKEIKRESSKNETSKNEENDEVEEQITEQNKINPWDELGISESDYYNKPMWSWARIDFDVNTYGSQEATEKACQDHGWELYEQGYGFKCTNVMSYSGKYLGEFFETF